MLTNPVQQKGLTLIEMMIAMVLGLFVTAVIISVFSTNVRTNVENIKMIRLNQELRGTMTFMVDELKRSGYSAFPVTATFMSDLNFTPTSEPAACARYSYDEDASGSQSSSSERFGFKLVNNEIKWSRNAGDIGPLGDADCSNGAWESITSDGVSTITALDFDLAGSVNSDSLIGDAALTTASGTSVYEITITITGSTDLPHSSNANDPSRTITETIRIRNDHPKD